MLDGEKSIIEDAVGGEASAFGALYDHYQPMIYRFVLVKVGHREEAEDLTHQVFLSAWQNIEGYKDMGFPFSSWLYKIARNAVVDFYRSNKEATSIEQVNPEFFAVPAAMQMGMDKIFEIDKVRQAIKGLDPIYQDVIMMRFVEDLPIREVAQVLDKSEGAIKLIQHRAMKKLKEILI